MARTLAAVKQIEHYFLTHGEGQRHGRLHRPRRRARQAPARTPAAASSPSSPGTSGKGTENAAPAITQRATRALGGQLRDAQFFALNPPPVRGLGQSSGFTMELLNTGGLSRRAVQGAR